jgi:glycosyltransferase involved in cell wall biosynthesis
MEICGVIPTYNNETTIERVIGEARRYLETIVVIDDGSTDGTAGRAERKGARVIRLPHNRGKGNALRVSFRYALLHEYDAVITLDADLQHDPHDIPKFIEHYEKQGSPIIVGNRMEYKEDIPRVRYVPNRVGMYLFSKMIGQAVMDSQCGFRLYDRKVMNTIPVVRDGFDAEADILLRAGKRGYKIDFVPIKAIYFENRHHPSYYRPVKDTFHISIVFLKNLFRKDR